MADDSRSDPGHGLLLVRRSPAAVARWLRRGLVSATVAPLGEWTGVTVAEDSARTSAPFDTALEVLAARPVPRRGRPALGFFHMHGRAAVTLHAGGLSRTQRWLVWQPKVGVVETPSLPRLGLPALVAAAGSPSGVQPRDLATVLRSGEGDPLDVLVTVLRLLHLPGRELLLRRDATGASDVEPSGRGVAAFDRLVAEEAQQRAEWEAAWGGRPPGAGSAREAR
ncbi:hypothetical protein JQN72_05385 [Phycicoccus sp. CSK15P-2]|uniref:hypothetical protein n=1 Tax=Phycicoccus sp. CSK15P-2 TaxID=2807627 RepID=UPI00194EB151|nr:hypothetical protein [Phycicoccus sp. CSK15P-2]MBM6403674.1 hypothetical protein [Phycicoccus sp. CSK15P-2]